MDALDACLGAPHVKHTRRDSAGEQQDGQREAGGEGPLYGKFVEHDEIWLSGRRCGVLTLKFFTQKLFQQVQERGGAGTSAPRF